MDRQLKYMNALCQIVLKSLKKICLNVNVHLEAEVKWIGTETKSK